MYCAHMWSTISILCALYWYFVWICRCCVCVLKTCVQCVDTVDTECGCCECHCFPSLTGLVPENMFSDSAWEYEEAASPAVLLSLVVGHQWTQRHVNLVSCILLIGPQKPLHPSDLFFIFSHVSSGDVSKAFSKFPFGTYVPQERVAPWQVIGGHFRTLDCSWEAASTYQSHYGSCSVQDVYFPALLSSSGSASSIYAYSVNSTENFLYTGVGGMVLLWKLQERKLEFFGSSCAHQVRRFSWAVWHGQATPWSSVLRTWSNIEDTVSWDY